MARHLLDALFLQGRAYQFWSGVGLTAGWPLLQYRKHLCHVPRCFLPGHIDPEHGHPACPKHHSHRKGL